MMPDHIFKSPTEGSPGPSAGDETAKIDDSNESSDSDYCTRQIRALAEAILSLPREGVIEAGYTKDWGDYRLSYTVKVHPNCEPSANGAVSTDCRSEEGITVGLIDGIIASARILAKRDLTPNVVREAIKDLRGDEDILRLLYGNDSEKMVEAWCAESRKQFMKS